MSSNFADQAMGVEQWRTAIHDNPDVTWRILQDVVKVVQAEASPKRTGRRPAPDAVGFDALLQLLYPERFSTDPFPDALAQLMGDVTQMAFARAIHVSQPQLSRLLAGKVKPDMGVMERAAAVASVSPAYFVEWRAAKLAELVTEAYLVQPNLSIAVVKQMARGTRP